LERESFGDEHHWFSREATRARRGSTAYLLPAFDECLVGYQDRSAFVDRAHVKKVNAGGGMLRPALVIEGRVLGTWQRRLEKRAVSIAVRPFRKLVASEEKSVAAAAERYAAFLGLPVHWA
ncbi:MAG TPA: crosslink repair DNA glycosylase YcaQ family protein, partial [Polyangiaceae bacterium]